MSGERRTAVFDALADPVRRHLLVALSEEGSRDDGGVDPQSLLVDLAAADDRLRSDLYHTHLPKLEEMGFVERDGETLHRGPKWDDIEPYVDLLRELHE